MNALEDRFDKAPTAVVFVLEAIRDHWRKNARKPERIEVSSIVWHQLHEEFLRMTGKFDEKLSGAPVEVLGVCVIENESLVGTSALTRMVAL